jgi:predicted nuclease of predicted toxin-antitoxin system
VLYIAELSPAVSDDAVLRHAGDQAAVLITADKDFGELVYRRGRMHRGVVLLRLAGVSNATKTAIVSAVCRERANQLRDAFTVVTAGQVRIRSRRD